MAEQKKKQWILYVLGGLILIALITLYAYQFSAKKPVELETVAAEQSDVEKTVQALGNIMMREFVDIGAKSSGQITNLQVSVGQQVKAGALLAEIAPVFDNNRIDDNRAQLARLQAELDGQQAQLEFARLQFQRQTQLKAENATKEEEYESRRMNMQAASSRVNAIQAQIRQVESSLNDYKRVSSQKKVMAPISGTIVDLSASVGQTVTANRDVLMRISDLSKMTVRVLVAENDVTRLHIGMVASFSTPGYPNKHWSGKLKQIMLMPEKAAVPQAGTRAFYPVLFDVDNPDGLLLSGMTANVKFLLEKVNHVVVVPTALVTTPDSEGFQTLRVLQSNGIIDVRKVKIGLVSEQKAQVVSGLEVGERIIVPPMD